MINIYKNLQELKRLNQFIKIGQYFISFLILVALSRAVYLLCDQDYTEFWSYFAKSIPLFAVLLLTFISNRLILSNDIYREDDRRQEIVRTTHHLIAISEDLKARIEYVKKSFLIENHNKIALLTITEITKKIEERYETLLEREAYMYLPGPCVDIIVNMSGTISGIVLLAEGIKHSTLEDPKKLLMRYQYKDNEAINTEMNNITTELQELIGELYKLRLSLDEE